MAEAGNGSRVLGVIELRDIVKGGIRERFAELREMGIKTIMVTGDNRLTAAAIAAEAGVDEFLAEATPELRTTIARASTFADLVHGARVLYGLCVAELVGGEAVKEWEDHLAKWGAAFENDIDRFASLD